MNVKEQINKSAVVVSTKETPKEVEETFNILNTVGFNNSTVKTLRDKLFSGLDGDEKRSLKQMIEQFEGFKIISHGTLQEIAKEYKLVIADNSFYERSIPEEVIESIKAFLEKTSEGLCGEMKFRSINAAEKFMSDLSSFNKDYADNARLCMTAPRNHFSFPKDMKQIGVEVGKFTFNKRQPRPPRSLDPILTLPFRINDKIFHVVIDAWEKEGDDSRLRQMI